MRNLKIQLIQNFTCNYPIRLLDDVLTLLCHQLTQLLSNRDLKIKSYKDKIGVKYAKINCWR